MIRFTSSTGTTVHVDPQYASAALSALAREQRWTDYFALLAVCELPEPCDPRKRQRIPVVRDVIATEGGR